MQTIWLVLFTAGLAFQSIPAFSQTLTNNTIHVFVALADNEHQGIVPVPGSLGNGQDPNRNLYWGAMYGLRTYFKRTPEWELLQTIQKPKAKVLERCIFKHKATGAILVADAYDGAHIEQATIDLLDAAAGKLKETITVDSKKIAIGGEAGLVAYCGHDGLMDFTMDAYPKQIGNKQKDVIILACISKVYFTAALQDAQAYPLVWTTGLMAPEAYTLKEALEGWLKGESHEEVRMRAAAAYNKYQKCGIKGAKGLLVTGF